MTTQYANPSQTFDDVFTDSVGRQNGINEEDWVTAFEHWQEFHDVNEPEESEWRRVRTSNDEMPIVDIKCRLEDSGWLVMTAFQGQPFPPDYVNPDYAHELDEDDEEADDDESRPVIGRALIWIPTMPGRWDNHN